MSMSSKATPFSLELFSLARWTLKIKALHWNDRFYKAQVYLPKSLPKIPTLVGIKR